MYLRFIFITNIETPVQNMNFLSAAAPSMLSYVLWRHPQYMILYHFLGKEYLCQ